MAHGSEGDDAVTGAEQPTGDQRQACDALATWLMDLLAAMPLDQSLHPRRGKILPERKRTSKADQDPIVNGRVYSGPAPPVALGTTTAWAEACGAEAIAASSKGTPRRRVPGEDRREEGGSDGETERSRRLMREEARSGVLRALAVLLAGCDDGTRCRASVCASGGVVDRGEQVSPAVEEAAATSNTRFSEPSPSTHVVESGRCVGGATDHVATPGCVSTLSQTQSRGGHEGGLLRLCLRLLSGCGGAAETAMKKGVGGKVAAPAGRLDRTRAAADSALPFSVPAGRKAELLQVVGNACFRCRVSQDIVRGVGGLPLILNHCSVDDANPLLR